MRGERRGWRFVRKRREYRLVKYAIIIPEGAAEAPLPELEGQTPLQAASTPHLDQLALTGRVGTAAMTPIGLPCTDDVTLMSLLGLDPHVHNPGPGVLEATGLGQLPDPGAWALRLSLVTIADDVMIDQRAGGIGDAEASQLLKALAEAIEKEIGEEADGLRLIDSSGHRGLMRDEAGRTFAGLTTHAPPMILGMPIKKYFPAGEHGELMRAIIELSGEVLVDHEVNRTREELGEMPATHIWPWGAGQAAVLPSFESRFGGLSAVMICEQHLPAGLAKLIGWDVEKVGGDSPIEEAGAKAVEALDQYDIVCVQVSSADVASHEGDVKGKMDALAVIDECVVGPPLERLKRERNWRALVMPSHHTQTADLCHDSAPVPLILAGKRIEAVLKSPYTEEDAIESDLHVDIGSELMEYFLFGSGIRRNRG